MWKRTGKEVSKGKTVNIYRDEARENPYTVESRKEALPHANGEGVWYKTFYWVVSPEGEDVKMFYSLKEAKMCAEGTYSFREKPYEHCDSCRLSAKNGGPCKVYDKYQRLPRDEYKGALGQCIKIGGSGC